MSLWEGGCAECWPSHKDCWRKRKRSGQTSVAGRVIFWSWIWVLFLELCSPPQKWPKPKNSSGDSLGETRSSWRHQPSYRLTFWNFFVGRASWKTPCISPTWVLLVTGVFGETKRGPPLRGKPDIQVFSEEQKRPLTWTEHRRHVLTAAHCLELRNLGNAAKKPSLLNVVVGLHNKE